ncbi:hypothetical protein B0T19DRAFT_459524 [Cercophora scortea]|uniref:WHIM1 domain-containing protein n=1 Tax=Cercophora scortea TaxID=314031 RepID=A0AAE0MK39_9PEZI|nr:hypothetical protein B0T19DRAFT_459524 [Cercophora scortea]
MADDDSSELSSVSSLSAPPSDDESDIQLERRSGILKFFHKVDKNPVMEPKETTPPRQKREPSPPHEYVLADNPDIAVRVCAVGRFIVMFRARFTEAFPKSLANFGPQELERDVVETIPGERVEHFLCALLGLLLNRKQDVKPGHYNRALEEAIQTHKGQWAKDWESHNPLANSATFATMTPVQRLSLLRTLVHWTLSSSDVVKNMINQNYKNRHDDDLNITLSVQPWGSDGDKRRYYLIEGIDDTAFRVYRESNPAGLQRTWWSVAGTIDELKALGEKLETTDRGPKARALAKRITNSIPRFEATEEKRRRREYRQMRKEQFKRPETGFSLYEGRTRGKRMKYTYSDDEGEFDTDSTTNRRSTRNTRNHTPAEPSGPVTTASGRQVRASARLNADSASIEAHSVTGSVQGDAKTTEDVEMAHEEKPAVSRTGRPRRSAAVHHGTNGWSAKKRKSEEYESDLEDDDEEDEPDFGDDEDDAVIPSEESDEDEFEEAEVEVDDEDLIAGRAAVAGTGAAPTDEDGSLLFKFPIRVSFGEDGKAEKHKRPRAAHRNIVVSDEDEEEDEDGDEDEESAPELELEPEPEEPASEVIAVAIAKPPARTTTPVNASVVHPGTPVKSPLNPSSAAAPPPSTALAFRGSPEKPQQQQHVAQAIDV